MGRSWLVLTLVMTGCYTSPNTYAPQNRAAPTTRSGALAWDVYGDTPSIAFSPDGNQLAIAHATRYFPNHGPPEKEGIEVADLRTGERRFVARGHAYHPVWLDADTLAYGCSGYECDAPGVYRVELAGEPRAERWVPGDVYHTLPGQPGEVVFYSMDQIQGVASVAGQSGWYALRADGTPRWLAAGDEEYTDAGGPSHRPPPGATRSTCKEDSFGSRGPVEPPWLIPAGMTMTPAPVEPCVSPDGRHLVSFSPNRVHVNPVR